VKTKCLGILIGIALSMAGAVAPARAEIKIGIAGPLTGTAQGIGEQQQAGAQKAIANINAAGGLLGQQLVAVPVDDACEPKQAEAAARQLVSEGVVFVVGSMCSGASIPESRIYEAAGIVMISPGSTNPKVTDEGRSNVFRVCGRDDKQGTVAGDYLADNYAKSKIAFINDGQTYGLGLAEQTKKRLNQRGVTEIMFDSYVTEQKDYAALVDKLVDAKADVLYVGGYVSDIALIIRQAKEKLPDLELVAGDTLASEDFLIIAGEAGEGAHFTFGPDIRLKPEASAVVAAFRNEDGYEPAGYTLYSYGAVQAWAQAVQQAGSLKFADVTGALHKGTFDTVLGKIGFDEKGDVTGISTFIWYVVGKKGYAAVK
jgi:branched-chain amino acid transport system substrate-binding protein